MELVLGRAVFSACESSFTSTNTASSYRHRNGNGILKGRNDKDSLLLALVSRSATPSTPSFEPPPRPCNCVDSSVVSVPRLPASLLHSLQSASESSVARTNLLSTIHLRRAPPPMLPIQPRKANAGANSEAREDRAIVANRGAPP
ncbi:hypothetical protein GALMADRAFT_257259 [Galerina marginata CBS 339.88]|uniref:Uncharacterized protein n=1 Tax=Galerina marginata (strain CBS 339.88) TaxID=685588 RepID=A0A067SN99_GALM3|nr:hypothetical protein GALMADRAFT_257259 [Galerina marginata CBS 339.88]